MDFILFDNNYKAMIESVGFWNGITFLYRI